MEGIIVLYSEIEGVIDYHGQGKKFSWIIP